MSRVLLIVVLVLGIAGSALAGPNDNWIIYLRATDSSGGDNLASSYMFGTKVGASDFPAETTNDSSNLAGSGSAVVLGAFDLGPGNYNNGYYKDLRAPYEPGVNAMPVWNLRLYVQPGWTGGDVYLIGWNQVGTYALNGSIMLALKVVDDPTGTYQPGTVLCTFGDGSHGTSAQPEFTSVFHNTSAISGGAYVSLQLVEAAHVSETPEPGSLASLAAAVGGFSGLAVLRRRRR